MLELFRYFNGDLWETGFDRHFVIEAELFGAFTEASGHLEIEEVDSVVVYCLFFVIFFEADRVRHSSCSFDDLIDDIVAYCTVFEADNVDNTIGFDGVLVRQLLVEFLWSLQVRFLFGLADTHIWKSVCDYDTE